MKMMSFQSMCYPRRRGFLLKILGVLTFIGFLFIWLKVSDTSDGGGGDGREGSGKGGVVVGKLVNNPIKDNNELLLDIRNDIQNNDGVIKLINHIEQNIANFDARPQFNHKKNLGDGNVIANNGGDNFKPIPRPNLAENGFNNLNNPSNLLIPTLNQLQQLQHLEEKKKAEALFREDEKMVIPGLGEDGKAVRLAEGEGGEKVDAVMKVEAFNRVLSDKISVNRSVPDSRDPLCTRITYPTSLPTASVIIIFTNEAWSPLIRTIHSVINRSPAKHLKEVLLVDDYSDRAELKEKLDLYIRHRLPPALVGGVVVRLLRLPSRHGLIRARLTGARQATGDVLIFLDSHCEVNTMWMEPLLARIKESRSAVLVPIIDVIDDKTLEYYSGNGRYFQVGGFTWSGHFTWIEVTHEEEKRRGSPVGPTRSPTMAGGLFAIDRAYFWEVGGYDEGMDVWGGENLEMSFRVWMCGGTLETLPCSRVGHIFRSFHPYTFPGNKDTHGLNTARLAEVWMEDYKRLYYMYRPELKTADWGDVSERLALKQRLRCNSFKWYLDNIFPQKFVLDEDSFAYGRLRNNASTPNLCLDTLQAEEKKPFDIGLYSCHSYPASSQFMSLSHAGELRREDVCAEGPQAASVHGGASFAVRMTKCHGHQGAQEWVMTKSGHLLHKLSSLCLDTAGRSSMASATLRPCAPQASQQWWFDHYNLGYAAAA